MSHLRHVSASEHWHRRLTIIIVVIIVFLNSPLTSSTWSLSSLLIFVLKPNEPSSVSINGDSSPANIDVEVKFLGVPIDDVIRVSRRRRRRRHGNTPWGPETVVCFLVPEIVVEVETIWWGGGRGYEECSAKERQSEFYRISLYSIAHKDGDSVPSRLVAMFSYVGQSVMGGSVVTDSRYFSRTYDRTVHNYDDMSKENRLGHPSWMLMVVVAKTNPGKRKKRTLSFVSFRLTKGLNHIKSMAVWKLGGKSFGHCSLFCLKMAQVWRKKYPIEMVLISIFFHFYQRGSSDQDCLSYLISMSK